MGRWSRAAAPLLIAALAGGCAVPRTSGTDAADDPYLWLEQVQGERALAWVKERNATSQAALTARPEYAPIRASVRELLQSTDRIPSIRRIGGHVYNLWTDAQHQRGLWRRTTLADYAQAVPRWETVLDIDALAASEKESWVWHGAECLPARTEAGVDRCMLTLSRGGSDAAVRREFDLKTRQFVAGGFELPEAKGGFEWIDRDTAYVMTDFGPGTLTNSGYPRFVKRWQRGTPLAAAVTVFEAPVEHVAASVLVERTRGYERHLFARSPDFHRREWFALRGGRAVPLAVPEDASLSIRRDLLLLQLRSAYTANGITYPAGALIATNFEGFLNGERRFETLFQPTPTRSLERGGVRFTRDHVLLQVLDNVAGSVEELHHDGRQWVSRTVPALGRGTLSVAPLHDSALEDDPLAEAYLVRYVDFLTPDSLLLAEARRDERRLLKQRPAFFDATGMRVEQRKATSRDGTAVPYFVVWPKGAVADGANPTLLTGYGGFQISNKPFYPGASGAGWLARGGVLVVANLRGGGEFGPAWHLAAIRENKQRSYDDFIAIAEDLIAQRVTAPRHLGIQGGSNGGLLVGAALTQRPELFGAVVCQVPLLDMRRFHKLLAGASWMAEYGNPDVPADWAFISRYSPYQQVRADARYPRVLFTTSTKDDRVHPAHARKMVARMQAQGHDVLYYENIEGGHGGAADAEQAAHLRALEYAYLWMQLGR